MTRQAVLACFAGRCALALLRPARARLPQGLQTVNADELALRGL
jgi:hypothetical protein